MLSGEDAAFLLFTLAEYKKALKREMSRSNISESAASPVFLQMNQISCKLYGIVEREQEALQRVLSARDVSGL